MTIFQKKPLTAEEQEIAAVKDFFDMLLPGAIRFYPDSYVCANTYRSVWVIKEYPPAAEEQAILAGLADRAGVTLRIYSRPVEAQEQRKIIQSATRRNRLLSGGSDVQETIQAQGNLQDVTELLAGLRRSKEPLLHCAVYIELKAAGPEALKELQADIQMELTRAKITVDRLLLRQREGFLSVMPAGGNVFGLQYERVLPATSAANLYPLGYSGKTDPHGFCLGRDKYGAHILVDFDRRTDDRTNGGALLIGNSGQGKSYLLKLLLTNFRESGKAVTGLDPEGEYRELTENLGGCYLELMDGQYVINPLEPRSWGDGVEQDDDGKTPDAFRKNTRLSQHIAYLKDFFRAYKDFTDAHLDTLEMLLAKLYEQFGITDETNFERLSPNEYPILSDLYELTEQEYQAYDRQKKHLYTEEILQELCLGLHSLCRGVESRYFNGHTNITGDRFLMFGVKGLLDTNQRLRDAMLFNLLSYMSHRLLNEGNTVASFDEAYLFFSNRTAVEYIRNAAKRARKKDSAVVIATQNVEDSMLEGMREYIKPLFAIPSHQFIFNGGSVEPRVYMDALQLEQTEFDLIRYPERGTCLYKCGNERYLLQVMAPPHKAVLFGKAGGR